MCPFVGPRTAGALRCGARVRSGWTGGCGGGSDGDPGVSDDELDQLRGFPEINKEELILFFTPTPADVGFIGPGRGGSPKDRLGLAVQASLEVHGVRVGARAMEHVCCGDVAANRGVASSCPGSDIHKVIGLPGPIARIMLSQARPVDLPHYSRKNVDVQTETEPVMVKIHSERARTWTVRPYDRADERAVLELVAADRLPGKPPCTPEALADAVAGRYPVGGMPVGLLKRPVTDVVHDACDRVAGVIAYTLRATDGTGVVLWAHARENAEVMALLLARARARLGSVRTWYAFPGTPATALAIEGLPVLHRPATAHALHDAGFTTVATRRYWYRVIDRPRLAACPVAGVPPITWPPTQYVSLTGADGTVIAQARIDGSLGGTAVLRDLIVTEPYQGMGIGGRLLDRCLDALAQAGAAQVIAATDGYNPDTPAYRLLDARGFTPIDTLAVYRRRPERSSQGNEWGHEGDDSAVT